MSPLLISFFATTIALAATAQAADGPYVPGMGEIMAATQMRHAKLWFAGQAGNWPLASYELDEIEEGLGDAVKYHPIFKQDAPVAAMLDKYTAPPLGELRDAVGAKDAAKFRRSFQHLTQACNGCHQAAGQGFIVIKRPDAGQFGNQQFAPVKDGTAHPAP